MQKKEGAFLSYDDFMFVARNFWGSAAAADFSSYEGKALAAKKIQDRTYAKESLILCDLLWPIMWVRFPENMPKTIPATLPWKARFYRRLPENQLTRLD